MLGYCENRKNPIWVCYRVFKVDSLLSPKRPSRLKVDGRTQSRISHGDYTHSGFDRGHMAPNFGISICYGKDGQLESFFMSNIVPQNPDLNRGPWRALEQIVAREYAQTFEEVWVITGPIFDDDAKRLQSGVEIPDAFFKVVVDEIDGKLRALAFLMKQSDRSEELGRYLTNVDEIEKESGFEFFSELDDTIEDVLEAEKTESLW